jgi:hypothetical protein
MINYLDTDLILEITRRCNFHCDHCLRGEPQNVRMSKKVINAAIEKYAGSYIRSISFTGGEPTLAPDLMEYTLDCVTHHSVNVEGIWFATNGSKPSKKLFDVLGRWIWFLDSLENTSIKISRDEYHDGLYDEHLSEWMNFCDQHEVTLTLDDESGRNIIGEGRAKDNSLSPKKPNMDLFLEENNLDGFIYVNALGDVLGACDLSYETQKLNIICTVFDDWETAFAKGLMKQLVLDQEEYA